MTDLAYLETMDAAYERSFRARVVSLPPGGVVLDRTLFYPTGGGQPHDEGQLAGEDGSEYRVVDVTRSGSSVVHRLARSSGSAPAAPRTGETLTGQVDWNRRYRFMRMHSGQHLVSALVFRRTGLRTHRAELRSEGATIDLERAWPASVSWDDFRSEVDREVREGRGLSVRWVPRIDWDRAPTGRSALVPLPAAVDPVRIIEIVGVDECPCGGTHVRSTREVGTLTFDGPPVPRGVGCRLRFTIDELAPTTSPS